MFLLFDIFFAILFGTKEKILTFAPVKSKY